MTKYTHKPKLSENIEYHHLIILKGLFNCFYINYLIITIKLINNFMGEY